MDEFLKYKKDLYFVRAESKYEQGVYFGAINDYNQSITNKGLNDLKKYKVGLAYYRGLCGIFNGNNEIGSLDLTKAGELGCFEAYDVMKEYCL